MGEIKRTQNFGLGVPEHFDPSVDKMSENMGIIDSALFKSIPSTLSDLTFNTALETGVYLIKGNSAGTPSSTTSDNYAVEVFATNSTHVYQIARSMANSRMHFRYRNGSSSFTSWTTIWNSANDGSGSGLDADLLDGQHGNAYVRNFGKTYRDFNVLSQNGFYQLSNATNSPDSSGGLWGCIVFQTDGAYSTTPYLCQIAIKDNTSGKQLYTRKKNGSVWTSWEKIWTSGTDGSGSGLDADTLDGVQGKDFISRSIIDYDVIVTSKSDWDNLISTSNWGGVKNVGIATPIGGASGWDNNDFDIEIPTNVKYIDSIKESFNSYNTNDLKNRIYCRSIKGHDSCCIRGFNITLNGYAYSYNNISADTYYMSDFYCVDNCDISFGNTHNTVKVEAEGVGRLYGLYNCSRIMNTYVHDSGVSSSTSGYKNLTYIANSDYLFNVTVYSSNNAYSRDTSVGFYNCVTLIGCSYHIGGDSSHGDTASRNNLYAGFYRCKSIIGAKVVVGGSSAYLSPDSLNNNVIMKECSCIYGTVIKRPFEGATSRLTVKIENCDDVSKVHNLSISILDVSIIDTTGIEADFLDGKHATSFAQTNNTGYTDFNSVPLVVGMYGVTGTATHSPASSTGTYTVLVTRTATGYMMLAINIVDSNIYRRHTTSNWSLSTSWTNIGGAGIQKAEAIFVTSSGVTSSTSNYLKVTRENPSSELNAGDIIAVTVNTLSSSTLTYSYVYSVDSLNFNKQIYSPNGSTQIKPTQIPKYFLLEYNGTAFNIVSPLADPTFIISENDPSDTSNYPVGTVWFRYYFDN